MDRQDMIDMDRQEVLAFLSKLAWFGGVWFLCLPALVVVALALPPYRRHQLVAGGTVAGQTAALFLVSALFSEGSEYYKMSSLAHVGSAFNHGATRARGGVKLAID